MTKLPRTMIVRHLQAPLAINTALVISLLLACLAMTSAGADAYDGHVHPAHAARTINATDEAKLHYVKARSSGSHLYEEGTATGSLRGKVHGECNIGATFACDVAIYTNQGAIRGHGTAAPHGSGAYESFAGSLTIDGGTARYAHAHGHAGLYGVFDRRTYALTVQTTGSLSY